MRITERASPVSVARAYFLVQAVGGAAWWAAVFASDDVRRWTLGGWDPAILVVPDLVLFVGASAAAGLLGNRVAAVITATWTTLVTVALALYGLSSQAAGWGVVLMSIATLCTLAASATMWFGYLPTGWFFAGPFSFRVADEGSDASHVRRSLAQLAVFWTTFFLVIPTLIMVIEERLDLSWRALEEPGIALFGACIFLVGSAIGLWSCLTMAVRGKGTPLPAETAKELVITGPYRFIRNPMAVGGLLQTLGVALVIGSWMVIVMAVAGALVWNSLIRPTEEADLADRFGEPYRRYSEDVRCWIPSRPT